MIDMGEKRITPESASLPSVAKGPLTPAMITVGCLVLLGLVVFVHLLLLYRA